MKKTKTYAFARFSADVLQTAINKYANLGEVSDHKFLTVVNDAERWSYDSIDEFLAHYRGSPLRAELELNPHLYSGFRVSTDRARQILPGTDLLGWGWRTEVMVTAKDRSMIESMFAVFESNLAESQKVPVPKEEDQVRPIVFVGHGRSGLWRELKDHLQDLHGFTIEAFETGARAGHTVRDVLEDLLSRASFAILVLTAEDELVDGTLRARQNVIHEAGLFQGRLGFPRAILLLEEGCEEFSNVQGVQQLRFKPGNIREVFGDVLATLRREFGNGGADPRRERPSRA